MQNIKMKFSERIGKTSSQKELQIDDMDDDLRNALWNILLMSFLDPLISLEKDQKYRDETYRPFKLYCILLWHEFFKKTVDNLPDGYFDTKSEIKTYFFTENCFHVYNLIEFSVDYFKDPQIRKYFNKTYDLPGRFNNVLEREFSAYRFIGDTLAPITNTTEIKVIDDILNLTNKYTPLKSCNIHLTAALSFLSDRENPDYRNSIKESISALESIAKVISGKAKDSLAGALDKIKGKLKIHAGLERGFKAIYGYTSDSDGIRHAITEESTLGAEDAQFMLVSVSAFINYLIVKANKAGINFTAE